MLTNGCQVAGPDRQFVLLWIQELSQLRILYIINYNYGNRDAGFRIIVIPFDLGQIEHSQTSAEYNVHYLRNKEVD